VDPWLSFMVISGIVGAVTGGIMGGVGARAIAGAISREGDAAAHRTRDIILTASGALAGAAAARYRVFLWLGGSPGWRIGTRQPVFPKTST
jgi:hypothetical protein